MGVIKSPGRQIFIFLQLYIKYDSQLIAPDLHLAFQNPTLQYVKA